MWTSEIVFYPGEDQEKLAADFVSACVLHRIDPSCPQDGDLTPIEIATYVFRGKIDAGMRGIQAAQVWARDIDILTRIKKGLAVGPPKEKIPKRDDGMLLLWDIATNLKMDGATRVKAGIAYVEFLKNGGETADNDNLLAQIAELLPV